MAQDPLKRFSTKKIYPSLKPRLLLLLLGAGFLFFGGFLSFCFYVHRLQPPSPLPRADALIVLTGGHNRLEPALHLLEQNYGKRLLISGVNPSIHKKALIRVTNSSAALFETRVDLGHKAENTASNALESASWIHKNGYKKVYLITNDYHAPRSLAELSTLLPHTKFILYPIKDKDPLLAMPYKHFKLLFVEYIKYMRASLKAWVSFCCFKVTAIRIKAHKLWLNARHGCAA